jgi:hypothetical protein
MKSIKISIILMAVVFAGCATIVKGDKQDVEVNTNPSGLTARINTMQCLTPCTLKEVSRKSEDIFISYKEADIKYPLNKTFNAGWVFLGNVWNQIWPGLIADLLTGAAWSIEPVDISFEQPKS